MSQKIARLINQPEQAVAKVITHLEVKNGYPSHDARMMAENVQNVRAKLVDLGLDPDDTTGEELYHALLVKFEHDSTLFDISYGATPLNFDEKLDKAATIVTRSLELPRQWVLKTTAAKNVLRQHPPKRVMKSIHYRSIESLLKREDVSEIYLAAQQLESNSWLKAHLKLVSHLDQTCFELRALKITPLSHQKWSGLSRLSDTIIEDNSVGAISISPSAQIDNAPLLSLVVSLIDALSSYQDVKLGQITAKLSDTVSWWADMDHLVAELGSEYVPLSLKDCALNHLDGNEYQQRVIDHSRASFWQELISRYENGLIGERGFDNSIMRRVAKLSFSAPELAFEFAEDF
jgi:hypothetical protein